MPRVLPRPRGLEPESVAGSSNGSKTLKLARATGAAGGTGMPEAMIVQAVRTPIGRHNGVLRDVRPDDLAALAVSEVVRRAGIDPAAVEEVYLGCANQAGEDNRNVARMAALLAGFPTSVAAVTFNRLCSSGL